MATFVDLGNMRAKLDTRTGQIRITSSEKDSLLKEKGFVLNVYRGSKEYILLNNLVKESNGEAPTSQGEFITGKELQSILAKLDRAETENTKAHLLADLVEWGDTSRDRNMLVGTIESLLYVEDYIGGLYRSGRYIEEESNWLTNLVEATRNTGAAMNRVDHVRANLDNEKWIKKLSDFVDKTYKYNMEHEKDDDHVHNSFIDLAHRVASYADGGWKEDASKERQLPKVVHMSEKFHSSVPDEIPLGIDKDGATFKWEAEKYGSLAVSGSAGSGKSMLLSSVVHHINQHKKTAKAYVSSMKWTKELNHDLYLDGLSLIDENIDINNNPLEYARKVHSMMMDRYEYMEKNHLNSLSQEIARGEMKRVFLIVDGLEEWLHLSAYSKPEGQSQETRVILGNLLRRGRGAGVHVVLSSQRDPSLWGIGEESLSNVFMRAETKNRGEIDLTVSNVKHEIRGFSLR